MTSSDAMVAFLAWNSSHVLRSAVSAAAGGISPVSISRSLTSQALVAPTDLKASPSTLPYTSRREKTSLTLRGEFVLVRLPSDEPSKPRRLGHYRTPGGRP